MFDPKKYKGLGGSPNNKSWPTIPKIGRGNSSELKVQTWPASSEADTEKPKNPFSSKGKNIEGDIYGNTTFLGENRENYLQNQKQLRVIGKLIKAGIAIASLVEILLLAGYNLNPNYLREHHPLFYNAALTQEQLFWQAIDLFEKDRITPDDLPPDSFNMPTQELNIENIQIIPPDEGLRMLELKLTKDPNNEFTNDNLTPIIVLLSHDQRNQVISNSNNIPQPIATVMMI